MARTEKDGMLTKRVGISVVVCCYNSAARIGLTLGHLFLQETDDSFKWEIIVVDNNSSDGTAKMAENLLLQSDVPISKRVVFEPKPGLSSARHKGFNEAMYNIVLMVDDDNSLCKDYLQGIWDSFRNNPLAGMVGGLGVAALETTAPPWFLKYDYCYAIGPQSNEGKPIEYLYGAGLALRMDVFKEVTDAGFYSLLSDRVGNNLMSGGDTELCFAFRMAGYELIYNPNISFQHHLSPSRLNWHYLRKLFIGFGQTKAYMDIYTSAIAGRKLPKQGMLPFWLDRVIYLSKNLIPEVPILICSNLTSMEGSSRVLESLAKLGHIKQIVYLGGGYLRMYEQVYSLRDRLKA